MLLCCSFNLITMVCFLPQGDYGALWRYGLQVVDRPKSIHFHKANLICGILLIWPRFSREKRAKLKLKNKPALTEKTKKQTQKQNFTIQIVAWPIWANYGILLHLALLWLTDWNPYLKNPGDFVRLSSFKFHSCGGEDKEDRKKQNKRRRNRNMHGKNNWKINFSGYIRVSVTGKHFNLQF